MGSSDIKRTQIGKPKRKIITGAGWSLLAAGTVTFIALSIFDDLLSTLYINPAGIAGMLFLLAFAVLACYCAVQDFSERCPVKCPCCGKNIRIKPTAQSKKCEFCKNISIRNGDMLEADNR
jgi:hypothetical protein